MTNCEVKKKEKCGEVLVKDGKTLICQRPVHTIWRSARHWDDRDGWHGWSEAYAEQQRRLQNGPKKEKSSQ